MTDVLPVARAGFGGAADLYARCRPEYPPELLCWLREAMRLGPGRTVVEIGAGTGKFTKLLVATGATVVAVEPVDAMRAELVAGLPAVRAIGGTAQATTLDASSCDAVVCAQAFHWFATETALLEFRRLLRPSGRLGLVWNVRDESVEWVAALTRILAPYEGDAPRYRTGAWRGVLSGAPFSAPEEAVFPYEHVGMPQRVIVDRSLSVSFVAALPASEQAKVRGELESLITRHAVLAGRETVAFPYRTHAFAFEVRAAGTRPPAVAASSRQGQA